LSRSHGLGGGNGMHDIVALWMNAEDGVKKVPFRFRWNAVLSCLI